MEVGGTVQRLNTMQYNELSQLETKYLHGDATDYLQRQDYAYNIRGWLTGINNILQGSSGVFAQKLYYNTVPPGTTGQATARYNGNISASEWRVDGITPTDFSSGYAYSYDLLNRLTKAAYYKRNIGSSVIGWEGVPASNKSNWGAITGIGSEKDITYDKNGNIKTLSRQARRNSDTDIVLFDNLSYTYNGNVLLRVSDAVIGQNTLGDFPGTAEQASETFFYDKNGNMTSDAVRGLRLSYDHNNMPLVIQSSAGTITNTYAWDGSKRRRVVLDDNNNTLSDECYYGDLVVENGQPLRILYAEGYVDVSGMPVFNYHLKDHLGNVRAVISSSYGPGAYTQTQASDYYPFGMAHTVEISSIKNGKAMEAVRIDPRETDESKTFTRSNAYLYNGKEEQPMPGKWLDYGARFYDAQLGRWHSVDPLAEERSWVSSFSYCQNDPINRIDPDGMYDDWVQDPNHPEKGTYFDPNIKSIGEAEDAGLIWHGHTTLLSDKDGNIKYGDQYGKTWDMAPLMEVVVLAKMTDHQRIMSNPYVQAIHQNQKDFLNHPVTQITVNTLLFVATGGIEGAVSLASGTKSVFNLAKSSQPSDWIRTGKTVVSNQIVKGQGATGATVTWGVKGGGNIAKTGESMGFHYHIHKYNWYNPASWFKQTPIIKPRKL